MVFFASSKRSLFCPQKGQNLVGVSSQFRSGLVRVLFHNNLGQFSQVGTLVEGGWNEAGR